MEVLQIIQGREAVPVRAIPLLTDWKILSPDKMARILAGEDDFWPTLNAYRLQPDGIVKQILPRWWSSWIVRKLQATSDAIKVQQISQAVGTQQWRRESIEQLPAGVFVWRDEFEAAHLQQYGALSMLARSAPKTFDASTYALDFNPEPPPDIAPQHLVLEGFAPAKAPPQTQQSPQEIPAPHPVPAAPPEAVLMPPQPEPAPPLPPSQVVPVVAESAPDFDNCLPTPHVATLFDGLPFSAESWPKRLSDTKWLQLAKRSAGEQGGASAMWCPLTLAKLISQSQQIFRIRSSFCRLCRSCPECG